MSSTYRTIAIDQPLGTQLVFAWVELGTVARELAGKARRGRGSGKKEAERERSTPSARREDAGVPDALDGATLNSPDARQDAAKR